MAEHRIVVFAGDYCGPEVVKQALRILGAIQRFRPEYGSFQLDHQLLGGCSIDAHGEPLTNAALEAAKAADAVLLGAVGGPKWNKPGSARPEDGLLRLRKEMKVYGNVRPINFAGESLVELSPLKAKVCSGTDFVVVRELTGGIYFGKRTEDDGSGYAEDREGYSRAEVERVAHLAGFLARVKGRADGAGPARVWSLDKANVLASSRLWRKTTADVFATEFPDVSLAHQLIDSAAMMVARSPAALNGIVLTSNLFGDIISDEASVICGSIGLLPSASLASIPDGVGKCKGVYEPIHGSAPDIAGRGVANPVGTILSAAMMLRYSLNLAEAAGMVEESVRLVLDTDGVRTRDLGGGATTHEMGDAIVSRLETLLLAR